MQRLHSYSESIGGLKIGRYHSLLFSHKLFGEESPLVERVPALLKEQMT